MCSHIYVRSEYSTQICTRCGREERVALQTSYFDVQNKAPLYISAYSRGKRFSNFLLSVSDPIHATHPPSKTIALLGEQGPYSSIPHLLQTLKKLKTSLKSYQHLHFFCMRFMPLYEPSLPLNKTQLYDIIGFFCKVEATFLDRRMDCSFFSYPWLCRKLLILFGHTQFLPYVKSIICKKRIAKYENMWSLLALDVMFKKFRERFQCLGNAFSNFRAMVSN